MTLQNENNETPKKPKRTRKKTAQSQHKKKVAEPKESNIPPDIKVVPMDEQTMEQFKQILQEIAQDSHKTALKKRKKINVDDQIHNFLSEYMDSYVLVGYNAFNRERILLRFSKCQQGSDSLVELVRMAFFKMVNEDIS